ncbi:MAG: S4 domain-containing protein [Flavobacteriia bacterium]|nr:S4 domain-containing protein [Flavobacteriia bacterium]
MKLRLDKFIWAIRISKTRGLAHEAISKGKIKMNFKDVKPSYQPQENDIITLHRNSAVFSYKVIALTDKRIGAKLVHDFIKNITPQEEIDKFEQYLLSQKSYRINGDGKPSKKDRRALDDFKENYE